MLALRPFISRCRPTPSLDVITRGIEHDHGWRSHRCLLSFERSRAMQNPNVVPRIDGHDGGIADFPLCRHLGPPAIHLEGWQAAALCLSRKYTRNNEHHD